MLTSRLCYRTLQILSDFAIVQSYLSTAFKFVIYSLYSLTRLFTGQPYSRPQPHPRKPPLNAPPPLPADPHPTHS